MPIKIFAIKFDKPLNAWFNGSNLKQILNNVILTDDYSVSEVKEVTNKVKALDNASGKLNALEVGGVDNWDCYEDALDEFYNGDRDLDWLLN